MACIIRSQCSLNRSSFPIKSRMLPETICTSLLFSSVRCFLFVSTDDTVDWKEERSAQTILDGVLPKLHPGCIILCHNNGYKIKEYLPTLLKTATSEGYEFVTISELLLEGETVIDVNGVQKKAAQ